MIDGYKQVSRAEHRALYALVTVGLAIWSPVTIYDLCCSEPLTAVYSIFDRWELINRLYCLPIFLLLSFSLAKISIVRLILMILPLGWLVFFYDRWFVYTQQHFGGIAVRNPHYPFTAFDFVLLDGSVADVLTLVIVNVLVAWQFSMIVRLWREP